VLDELITQVWIPQITETRDLIRSLGGSHMIILSTHILPEVAQTCQRGHHQWGAKWSPSIRRRT
jgi:ABC-2 type transport system ATP-binding protein